MGEPVKMRSGRHGYGEGWRFANGAEVWADEDPDTRMRGRCTVDFPGSALATWSATERLELMGELVKLGADRLNRLDLALDFFGEDLTLIEDVSAACKRRELVFLREVGDYMKYRSTRKANPSTGRTITIGTRWRGGTQLVFYDKGLESGTSTRPGQWVRVEGRFLGGRSAWVALERLLMSLEWERTGQRPADVYPHHVGVAPTWREEAVRLVLGMVDFREVGGDTNVTRRPQAEWWRTFCDGLRGDRIRASDRSTPSLRAFKCFFQRCVAPAVRSMTRIRGGEVLEVLVDLGLFDKQREGGRRQVLEEYRVSLGGAA
jgi:hypothetical protein